MLDEIMQSLTQDWLATFEDPANQNGFMWRMTALGELPFGVDQFDERVKALVELAKNKINTASDTNEEIEA